MSVMTDPSIHDLRAVVEEVWTTFLGEDEPLFPAPEPLETSPTTWSAAVTISGAWRGMVTVRLSDDLAQALSHRMLGLDPDGACAPEDLVDATGELVNVIGGNVKSLVPGPSSLSLPVVAHGHIAASSDLQELALLHYSWAGHPVAVEVLAQPAPGSDGGTP